MFRCWLTQLTAVSASALLENGTTTVWTADCEQAVRLVIRIWYMMVVVSGGLVLCRTVVPMLGSGSLAGSAHACRVGSSQ